MNNNSTNLNGNNNDFSNNNGMSGVNTQPNLSNSNTTGNNSMNLDGVTLGNLETLDSNNFGTNSVSSSNMEMNQVRAMNSNTMENVNPVPNPSMDTNVVNNPSMNVGMEQMGVANSNTMGNVNPVPNPSMGTAFSGPNMNISNNNSMNPNDSVNPSNEVPNFFVPNSTPNNSIFDSVPTPPTLNDFNNDSKKEKKKLSKTTILILVILLIFAIGAGIYFVLNYVKESKPKGSITLRDPLTWELGQDLSSNVEDYATITGYDLSTCSVDTSKVDNKKMGSYDYTITCGAISKSGKMVLQDKKAPNVVVKEVSVVPNASIALDDFIVSCQDFSKCSYVLEDEKTNLDEMIMNEGTYHFNIIVSDDYNNQTVVKLTLNVTNDAPVKNMFCSLTSTKDEELKADVEITYNYGINSNDVLATTEKIYTYTFENREAYQNVKNSFDEGKGINGVVGVTVFDDDEFMITITNELAIDSLVKEFNVSNFSTDYYELKQFNIDQGISCKLR